MTTKEKAAWLVLKYMSKVVSKQVAKECALVAVDELISVLNQDINPLANYWYEVKEEIEKV
jgi:hypothetical protein